MNAAAFLSALTQLGTGVRQGSMPVLQAPEAWQTVLELAIQHRVAPLVWQALTRAPACTVPEPIVAELEAQMWRSSATRMLCEHALESLLETLAARGIEVLVLKGATLAHELYPRPELRPYHDLDILCRPGDYPRLAAALLAEGYSSEEQVAATGNTPAYEGSRRRNFITPCGDVEIEVHLDVLGLGIVERHHDDFWRAARTVEAGPLRLRTLAPMHQLLHLTFHVHAHCYSRLLWLHDIDLLIRRWGDAIDGEQAMALARDEGMGAVLRHVLATAHAVLGTPLLALPPPTLEERLLEICYRLLWPQATLMRLERKEHRRLLRFRPGTGDLRDVVYPLLLLGRRREKWRILRRSGRRPSHVH